MTGMDEVPRERKATETISKVPREKTRDRGWHARSERLRTDSFSFSG